LCLADVKYWSEHTDREVWTINLLNKKQIISDDDPRAVYGIDPKKANLILERFYPKDAVGVMVPVLTSSEEILSDDSMKYVQGFGKLKNKIDLNKEVGYVVGASAGDAWADNEYKYTKDASGKTISEKTDKFNKITLAGIETEVVDQYKYFIRTEFFKDSSKHIGYSDNTGNSYGKSEKHIISSVDFATLIQPWIGKGANNKHLPSFWFKTPREFRIGLLSGILDTDGSIAISNIGKNGKKNGQLQLNVCSNSIRLLQETKQLLLSLGVRSTVSFSKKTQADNDAWILSISSVDIQNIKHELNIAHASNKLALASLVPDSKSPAAVKTDNVLITADIIKYLV